MADEANTAKNPLDTSEKLDKSSTDEPNTIKNQESTDEIIEKTKETDENCETTAESSVDTETDESIVKKSVDDHEANIESPEKSENNSPTVQKPRKTYENRKNNTESTPSTTKNIEISSPELPTTSSPQQNTSRYGRARKPKITEDFYNIEDIFGPYERIPTTSPRKKSHKLELSPNKNKETVNLQEIKSIDLNSVLSINIPDDSSIEVSKVMKIVSNNSEFSPKSPSYSSKSVKVYKNKKKTTNNESFLDEYDLDFLNGVTNGETSDSSDETVESVNKSVSKLKTSDSLYRNLRLLSDESLNDSNDSDFQISVKRTKNKGVSPKKNSKNSEIIEMPKIQVVSSDEHSKIDDYSGNSTDSSIVELTNKKLNKLQKDLNIGELKSGRLRSSIPESEMEIITEVKNDKVVENKPKKSVVIAIDDTDEITEPNTYSPDVGNLSWARVGSYPFWPSIVTVEPGTSRHFKSVIFGRKNCKCYHVHFFGDNGRRSWVLATHIFPFTRRSDLETMAQSVSKDSKPKDPKHLSAFIINPNKLKKWETAVTEAENITDFAPEIRIEKFFELVSPKKKGKKRPFPSPKLKTLSHKKIKLDKKFKYQAKRLLPSRELASDIKIKLEDKSPSPSIKDEPLDDKIPKPKPKDPKNPEKTRKIPKFPKTADDSKSEDSFSGSSDITLNTIKQEIRDTPSPQPQISLLQRHKRVNLFRGITKDRVCQICGKNKNVYKCKGNCFGLYHIECDKKIRQRVLLKKMEEQSSVTSLDDSDFMEADKIDESSNKDTIVSSVLDDILLNVFETVEAVETVETVDQPDKTIKQEPSDAQTSRLDDPDDKKYIIPSALSLAEQIDLKMQEVMQNLITETKYTDSTTDEGSENDETESIVIDPFQSKSTSVDLSQSESSKSEEYSHLPTCDEDDTKKVTRKVIKHVTADGIFDVIEEEETNEDFSSFKCAYCYTGILPPCFICNKDVSKSGDDNRHKCITPQCGKYFHSECLKDWPQTKWNVSSKSKKIENETLSCPYHNCHTCISDDPRGPLSRYMNEKLSKCIRCPTTYHSTNYCIPAGTEILSTYQLICPKHLQGQPEEEDQSNGSSKVDVPKKPPGKIAPIDGAKKPGKIKVMHHVNASWCFICSMGGSLICCETCPSSFHVECLKLVPPEGRYLCEECESGRLPLYDEIVWVKLGAYRWWPAQILYPADIPPNVASISHTVGEFVVRFFGSHDHYWVNRGRVFLFQEGDTGHASSKKSAVDGLFVKAIQEATRAHKKFVEERANRAAEAQNGMKPPSYIKIKVNRPVGNVRSADADTSNTTPCDCDPRRDQPCGPDSDCLNRILLTECNAMVCAAGSRCCNQSFEKRLYSPVAPFKTTGRGWGLKTLAPVKKGSFVIEYVGEVIDEKEYQRRMKRKHEQKDENYYFLTIDKDRMIDAGPKGNVARFMNHSCSPNCETQKWRINGDTRVGLFAITDIPSDAELTFNYNLECIGEEKKECRCGAPNCSGFIGVKAKQDEVPKKLKRKSIPLKHKKKKSLPAPEIKLTEVITCFICGEPDAIQRCDRDACNKFYHLSCVSLEFFQEGKWFCPWHSCNTCTKRTTRCCYMCINSYCPLHSEGKIRYDRVKGFICTEHDIKEDDDSKEAENSLEDKEALKTKDPIKIKKNKKPIRPSMDSNQSAKLVEETEIEDKLKKDSNDEDTSSSSEDSKEKKSKIVSRKSSRSSKTDDTDESEEQEEKNDKNSEELVDTKKLNKAIKDNKNGVFIKSVQLEESANSSNDMLQIDIFVSSDSTIQNNNQSTIKKRKSRLSLRRPPESSNSASISSQDDDISEDEPLVKLKKIKLAQEISRNSPKFDATTKLTDLSSKMKKANRSMSSTEFDSSGGSESDFVISPKKTPKPFKTFKKMKTSSLDLEDVKKLRRATIKNNLKKTPNKLLKTSTPKLSNANSSERQLKKLNYKRKYSLSTPSYKTKSPKKFNLSLHKTDTSLISPQTKIRKLDLSLYKKGMRRSIRNLKQYKNMQFSEESSTSSSDEKKVFKPETISTPVDLNSTKKKKKLSLSLRKSLRATNSDKIDDNLEGTVKVEEPNLEIEPERDQPDKPTIPTDEVIIKRKLGRPRKIVPNPEDTTDTTLQNNEEKEQNGGKKKLGRPRKIVLISEATTDTTLQNNEDKEQNGGVKKLGRPRKIVPTPEDTTDTTLQNNEEKEQNGGVKKLGRPRKIVPTPEETTDTTFQNNEEKEQDDGEVIKRKPGRPRKYPPIATITSESADVTDSETPQPQLPVVKRPIGRPRKQKILPELPTDETKITEPVSQVTELYKMKLSDAPKNPFDNVNEVKLTANVPERHLRVVLRKHSEIDSKIDNKFLKMQNDIERDLPIRKRSKLRYEAQL